MQTRLSSTLLNITYYIEGRVKGTLCKKQVSIQVFNLVPKQVPIQVSNQVPKQVLIQVSNQVPQQVLKQVPKQKTEDKKASIWHGSETKSVLWPLAFSLSFQSEVYLM